MFGAGRASSDYANPDHDEGDAGPALRANMLVQPENGEQDHEDVADRGRGENVREVGERERSHVAEHEGEEKENSYDDKRVRQRGEDMSEMVNVDRVGVLHATREECVSGRAEKHDRKNY